MNWVGTIVEISLTFYLLQILNTIYYEDKEVLYVHSSNPKKNASLA